MFALFGIGLQELIVLAALFFGVAIPLVGVSAYQAYRRGYNPFVWGLAGIAGLNPIFILVVLAMAPHKARQRLREQFRRELDAKLAGRGGGPAAAAGGGRPVRDVSVGDAATEAPGRLDTHSVGDQATQLPHQRSIGDDQTRL